ncbi:MAG: T9SS type A sorting domain-containing protein [Bacteroidetes bacterium]|nr:T9SS type A sorting domain-containing protein [Bacteroidota bacterium]
MRQALILVLFLISFNLQSQTIVTLPLETSEICQEAGVRVPFAISGAFSTDNIYTAQISDVNGSFGLPTGIGFVYGFNPDTIDAVIPLGIPPGLGYRIRVVSSSPYVEGIDNGVDLSILEVPGVTFQTIDTICFDEEPFDMAGGFPLGGFYFGTGVEAGAFFSATAGFGHHQLSYTYTAPNGCSATDVDSIFVEDCTVGIKKQGLAESIKVFPNPAKDELTVFAGSTEISTISILTINGQVLSRKSFKPGDDHSVSVSNIPPGLYLLVMEIGNERVVKKIIIE